MFFRRKNIRPYDKASVIVGGKCFARSEQKLTDAGRPGPPEAYLSPFFVPSGDLDVPEGFSKNGDTLVNGLDDEIPGKALTYNNVRNNLSTH